MRPRLVEYFAERIGTGFFVPDYAFMHMLAILVGVYFVVVRAEKAGLDGKKVFRTCLIVLVSAYVSARLYVVLQLFDYYLHRPVEVLQVWKGGMASFGALTGGFLAVFVYARRQRLPLGRLLDSAVPATALAFVFARVGCFLNGCCFGRVSNLPWALRFPEGSGPYEAHLHAGLITPGQLSLPVHPTQLYEAVYMLILFFVLLRYRKRQKYDGELTAILFVLYPLWRFFNEFLRADARGSVYFLTVPQVFCIISVALAGTFLFMNYMAKKRGNKVAAEHAGPFDGERYPVR